MTRRAVAGQRETPEEELLRLRERELVMEREMQRLREEMEKLKQNN